MNFELENNIFFEGTCIVLCILIMHVGPGSLRAQGGDFYDEHLWASELPSRCNAIEATSDTLTL